MKIHHEDLFSMTPGELIEYLADLCEVDLPIAVDNVDDMQKASNVLGQLGPLYSFLINMELRANIKKRAMKKDNKQEYDIALVQEKIFQTYAEQVKMLYNSTSRMLSAHQQINEELRMLKHQI